MRTKQFISDEKWFDQDGQYNQQNACAYAEPREIAHEDFATRPAHKFPFKVSVWVGFNFNGIRSGPLPQEF